MMTGAQTCVTMLNPAVNQTTLPYGMTRMGLNPAEERKRDEEDGERNQAGKEEHADGGRKVGGEKEKEWLLIYSRNVCHPIEES